MYDAIFTERSHTPAVVIANEGFARTARAAASVRGMPGVRIVTERVPSECTVPERIASGVNVVLDDLVAALTKPLSLEERSPTPPEAGRPPGVVFKGDLAEVQQFFYRRGWTDGLPVIPPTEDAVVEMLTGTDLPRDHVVGRMAPLLGKVTVEKVAVNAVMAGALPTYMPVLLACVEALHDPAARFGTWQVSIGSWSPFWILNGPIREQLRVNGSTGALSPGDMANAAIGRAMGLIIKNLGGARKGIEDMGVLGNPGKYSMVTAENEEAIPESWEPLHVQQGFSRGESCVTLSWPNSYLQIGPYGSDDIGIMRAVSSNLLPAPHARWRQLTLLVPPGNARVLGDGGWTQHAIAAYLHEHARVPASRTPGFWAVPDAVRHGRTQPPNEHDLVPLLPGPDAIRIVVAGGPGLFMGLAYGASNWVTKPVHLPSGWDGLVAGYRDFIPDYVRY